MHATDGDDFGGSARPSTNPQPVKTFDAGIIGGDEYAECIGISATSNIPVDVDHASSVPISRRKKVIIVGAGINGIQQASTLLRDGCVTLSDIQIVDALDDYGGVWKKNVYPGCACDVPAMIYTTSYEINRDWTHFYAKREDIQTYYGNFALKYGLDKATQFGSFVESCTWDEDRMVWHVGIINKASGEKEHWIAEVICQCVGSLDRPKFGNTPGRENYKGITWHTAHWNSNYDLTDKRVAIIGCGPSAAQIIPEIVDKTDQLTVYMRTPPVCVPRNDFAYSSLTKWAWKWVPMFAWLFRMRMNLRMMWYGRRMAMKGDPTNERMTEAAVKFMESQISDPNLRDKVRPHSKYYCKRPLRLDNFYPALAKPNCTVLREDLVRYTEAGVISRDNGKEVEREFDVIIYGTGFNVAQFLEHEKVTGIGGVDLQKKWRAHPEALYGLATSGFPNMFYCFGPNSAHVWSSQQDNWEQQARLATKFVREIVERARVGKKLAVHPNRDAERNYNTAVQHGQSGVFVWSDASCVTYYKNDDGWNTYTMPWTWWQFRRMLRKIRWEQWEVIEKPISEPKISID